MYIRFWKILTIFVVVLLFLSCNEKSTKKDIVATVDGKVITAKEFRQRAEFTIRPEIFADERIVLNNLIAEKILAIEAEKNSRTTKPEFMKNFITGLREQAMREKLYYTEVYNRISIDSAEVDSVYPLSNRTYELEFYNLGKKAMADSLAGLINGKPDQAIKIFDQIAAFDSVPKHTVNWQDPDSYIIHDALFSKPLKENQVIGPLALEDNSYLIMKVLGWKYAPVIGPEAVASKRKEVQNKLKDKKAEKEWTRYMQTVMQGKDIEFEPEIFNKLAELSFSVYSQGSLKDKPPLEEHSIQVEATNHALGELTKDPAYKNVPFFTIDGTVWSIKKFMDEIAVHPLVFRQQKIFTLPEYKRQFRSAVADLVRDRYLTQIAYDKSLDKSDDVLQTVSMWQDATLAQTQWYDYLESLKKRPGFDPKNMKGINNYLGQYVDSLMTRYKQEISVNDEAFRKIKLTKIPMYVYKPGMPYPAAVPVFPQLTLKREILY